MCHKCIVLVQKDKLLLPRSRFAEQFTFHKQRQYLVILASEYDSQRRQNFVCYGT